MKETLHLIALRTIRHNERNSVLTAYTLEHGMMAFLQPAGAGKEAARRRALLMPMGLVEGVADIRPGRDIHPIGQLTAPLPLQSLRSNPIKSSVAMFLAEVILSLHRESQPDAAVWHYIKESIVALDAIPANEAANFHITFLVRMMPLLGIMPDISTYKPGSVFDMANGVFRSSAPLHRDYLTSDRAALLPRLSQITYINMHLFKHTRDERARLLDGLLHYYTLHYAPMTSLRTLDILRTLF